MQYPTILEYVKAIQNAGANLDWLAHLSPVLDDHGEPYLMSGDSSVVFKMQDKSSGKYYALKCFTKAQNGSADASSNIGCVKYLEKELLVLCQGKEEKYPVELMEWVDEESVGACQLEVEDMSTEAPNAVLNEAITDEFGVKYSKDGMKLLEASQELKGTYSVKKGTKIICDSAFSFCTSLSNVVIPDGVTSVGNRAFWCCTSLSNVVIPDSVTSIGESAFWCCKSLKRLEIPKSVTSIGDSAFHGWNGELICSSPCLIYEKNVLFDKNKSKILSFRDIKITTYVIPDGVTSIGDDAFLDCSSLHSLVIPNSVTSIGNSAFYGCSSLRSLVIPDSVISIGNLAFGNCSTLSSIIIPNSVTSIGNDAFSGCTSLSSVVIPDSVTRIGNSAFCCCSSLKSLVIPDGVTCIGDNAFSFCTSLSNLVLPDSVTSIGAWAFDNCFSLNSLVISGRVTCIGNGAFSECSSLRSVVIPDSVTSIGSYAFRGCFSLESLVIPDSVISIGNSAFYECNFQNDLKQELISRFGDKIFVKP